MAAIFTAIIYFHLTAVLLNIYDKKKQEIIFGYFISGFLFISGFTPLFVNDVAPMVNLPWYPQPGPTYHIFALLFVYYVTYSWYLMIKAIRKEADNSTKIQLKYIFLGTLISFTGGSTNFLPVYGISIPPLGNALVPFYVILTAIAILKYHLFEMKLILTELLVFILGLILAALPFLMPSLVLIILTTFVFILFLIFGYHLIRTMYKESKRREEAESVAAKERELRREAEVLAADLKRLDQAKTQFLLSTQHHLRSPLSVVQGYLSMIYDGSYGDLPPTAKEKIGASLDASQKLIHLVDNLLDMAHFQMSAKGAVDKKPVDVVELVANIVVDLQKFAQEKNIYLRFKKPDFSLASLALDAVGMREAIYNIIDNAVKYTFEGGVEVVIAAKEEKLCISVKDTGIGMNEKDRAWLFSRTFERGEKAKNVNIEGKGIGLYLAAQMIISNGGTIRAESAGWGKGSEFIIELPLAIAAPQ